MTNFFLKDGDAQLAQGAQLMDDMDLVPSKEAFFAAGQPAIVCVAVRGGNHVCWYCSAHFLQSDKALKPAEVALGHARILLHAGCVDKKPRSVRSFHDIQRGVAARRFFAKAVKTVSEVIGVSAKDDE